MTRRRDKFSLTLVLDQKQAGKATFAFDSSTGAVESSSPTPDELRLFLDLIGQCERLIEKEQ